MYKRIDGGRPWWTPRIRLKVLDRRSFILILDSMLVNETLTSLFQTFTKKKRQNLNLLNQSFYSAFLTHQFCHK